MAIEKVINPADDSEMIIAKGVIKRIIYKEAKPNNFGTTHNAAINIDDDWINFISMKVKEGRQPQLQKVTGTAPNLNWEDINEGDEVKIILKQTGEYNGKPQYTTGTSKINIIKKGSGAPANQSKPSQNQSGSQQPKPSGNAPTGSQKVYGDIKSISEGIALVVDEKLGQVSVTLGKHASEVQEGGRLAAQVDGEGNIVSGFKAYGPKATKDDIPVKVGHSLNVALESGLVSKVKDIAETLPDLLAQIEAVREQVAKENPTMDSYSLGARFGQSVVTAARLAKKGSSTESILSEAVVIFNSLNEVESKVRENLSKPKEVEIKTQKENKVETKPEGPQEPPMDFDESIPF